MVTGPKDAGQTPSHDPKRDTPHRPDAVHPSIAWPERPDMVSQNVGAQRTFERNSERLQQAQEAKREPQSQEQSATQSKDLSFVKDRSRYNELKKENAVATGRDTAADQSQQQGIGSKDLSFAKDRDPGNYNDLKKEQSVATGKDAADGRGEQPASGARVQLAQLARRPKTTENGFNRFDPDRHAAQDRLAVKVRFQPDVRLAAHRVKVDHVGAHHRDE